MLSVEVLDCRLPLTRLLKSKQHFMNFSVNVVVEVKTNVLTEHSRRVLSYFVYFCSKFELYAYLSQFHGTIWHLAKTK